MRYLMALLSVLAAANAGAAGKFYDRADEGWFFYNEQRLKEMAQEKPSPEKPEVAENPVEVTELPPAPSGPAPMSVEWFQQNFDEIQNRAIDNPTPENVAAFYVVHQQMMHKSTQFARVAAQVLADNPDLDPRVRFSNSVSGEKERQRVSKQMMSLIFDRLKDRNGGVWFFFDNSNVSRQMVNGMISLAKDFDVDILPVAVDGAESQLEGMRGADLLLPPIVDGGLSDRIQLGALPAVVLAIPPSEVEIVGYGTLDQVRMAQRIPAAARLMGILSEEEFLHARGELRGAPNAARQIDFNDLNDTTTESILRQLQEARK
ncbi:conjugal transfer protein TraF [Marinobacter alkaliphilus]|uniref:Conjugal transfer protein TraF n=1 Tax=Marinobacter alkaliphilus TaxID=254719 RepID=A0ABZ3E9R1_9GAMM